MKTGAATSEFWLSAGGAAYITQAPTGWHAASVAAVMVGYALARAWVKRGAA